MHIDKLNIGIIGFGRFGQFIGQNFAKFHNVFVTSRTDYSKEATNLGVIFCKTYDDLFLNKLDVLVISTSILSFYNTVINLPKNKIENILIVDVLSVKSHAKQVLLENLPSKCDILCTHPMFGPDSGRYTWKNLPFVYEKVRITNYKTFQYFIDIFINNGCKMVEMLSENHDVFAANSQFITHFTGRMLDKLKLQSTPINTQGFNNLLDLVDNTSKDSFELFYALFKYNSNSKHQVEMLKDAFNQVLLELNNFDNDDNNHVNKYVSSIKSSSTVSLASKVSELQRNGKIIYSLVVGEPDFETPESICQEVSNAMAKGYTKYTNIAGIYELREEICNYLKNYKQICYSPEQILCTNGAKQGIYMAVLCLLNEYKNEVVIPAPYWTSYPDIVKLCGGKPVIFETSSNDYIIDIKALEKCLTSRTRIVVLCNPSNPTGVVQSGETLNKIAELLNKKEYQNIIVISDEIYERIVYDGSVHVSFASLPNMYSRTITINGFSKSYGMTGFRLGYMASTLDIINNCKKILSQTTHAPNTMSQYAGIAALKIPDYIINTYIHIFKSKRDYTVSRLSSIKGLSNILIPQGAFYILPNISYFFGKSTKDNVKVSDSLTFCIQLLENENIAVNSGDAFGDPNTIRISYSTSMDILANALNGLEKFCKELDDYTKFRENVFYYCSGC
jgi:aspartate/methionine/tyrosine aminotransferase/prephenate dehydrogenase